jgi:hypothetical protein
VGSGHVRTVLLPACAPNAGAKLSSPLVVSRRLEQRLQLLTHTSLLGGRRLWAAAQQHGCRGEVLRHLPEEWRGVSVGVSISVDVCALVDAPVVVVCSSPGRRRRRAGPRLFGSQAALPPLAVPLAGLLLHRNVLCRLSIARLWVHPQLLVKKGQLLVELALGLRELVEPCPSLGVGGAVLAPVRSCSMSGPHRRCTPAWGRVATWFVPSGSL